MQHQLGLNPESAALQYSLSYNANCMDWQQDNAVLSAQGILLSKDLVGDSLVLFLSLSLS